MGQFMKNQHHDFCIGQPYQTRHIFQFDRHIRVRGAWSGKPVVAANVAVATCVWLAKLAFSSVIFWDPNISLSTTGLSPAPFPAPIPVRPWKFGSPKVDRPSPPLGCAKQGKKGWFLTYCQKLPIAERPIFWGKIWCKQHNGCHCTFHNDNFFCWKN